MVHFAILQQAVNVGGRTLSCATSASSRRASADSTTMPGAKNRYYFESDDYYLRRIRSILREPPNVGPPLHPVRLLDHVYMGGQRNADDLEALRRLGITHVLNCAGLRHYDFTRSPYPRETGVRGFLMISAEDAEAFDIASHFDDAIEFLDRVKKSKGCALVHCNMGVNRSGAIVAAYLMISQRQTLLDVITYLKRKRSVVLTNKGFRRQLVQFARDRGLLDPVLDDTALRENNPTVGEVSKCGTKGCRDLGRPTYGEEGREGGLGVGGRGGRGGGGGEGGVGSSLTLPALQSMTLLDFSRSPASHGTAAGEDVERSKKVDHGKKEDGRSSSRMSSHYVASKSVMELSRSKGQGVPVADSIDVQPMRSLTRSSVTFTSDSYYPASAQKDTAALKSNVMRSSQQIARSSPEVISSSAPTDTSDNNNKSRIKPVSSLTPVYEISSDLSSNSADVSEMAQQSVSPKFSGFWSLLGGARRKPTRSTSYSNVSSSAPSSMNFSLSSMMLPSMSVPMSPPMSPTMSPTMSAAASPFVVNYDEVTSSKTSPSKDLTSSKRTSSEVTSNEGSSNNVTGSEISSSSTCRPLRMYTRASTDSVLYETKSNRSATESRRPRTPHHARLEHD